MSTSNSDEVSDCEAYFEFSPKLLEKLSKLSVDDNTSINVIETSSSDESKSERVQLSPIRGTKQLIGKRFRFGRLCNGLEEDLNDLPPINLFEVFMKGIEARNCEFKPLGKINDITDRLVIVESFVNTPLHDYGSLLFLENGKRVLGEVFDVLGKIQQPLYAVRFNSSVELEVEGFTKGMTVYWAHNSDTCKLANREEILRTSGKDDWYITDNEDRKNRKNQKKKTPNTKKGDKSTNKVKIQKPTSQVAQVIEYQPANMGVPKPLMQMVPQPVMYMEQRHEAKVFQQAMPNIDELHEYHPYHQQFETAHEPTYVQVDQPAEPLDVMIPEPSYVLPPRRPQPGLVQAPPVDLPTMYPQPNHMVQFVPVPPPPRPVLVPAQQYLSYYPPPQQPHHPPEQPHHPPEQPHHPPQQPHHPPQPPHYQPQPPHYPPQPPHYPPQPPHYPPQPPHHPPQQLHHPQQQHVAYNPIQHQHIQYASVPVNAHMVPQQISYVHPMVTQHASTSPSSPYSHPGATVPPTPPPQPYMTAYQNVPYNTTTFLAPPQGDVIYAPQGSYPASVVYHQYHPYQ